tara:strand:- start:502 stop:804 length:303 start_codon:yes stop_codon:yes gene_type:complete
MGAIINGSINVSKLPKDKLQKAQNGDLYYNFTMGVNDDTSDYGDNCSVWNQQTKEEREAKTQREYTGNAKVTWTDGKVVVAAKKEKPKAAQATEESGLPF